MAILLSLPVFPSVFSVINFLVSASPTFSATSIVAIECVLQWTLPTQLFISLASSGICSVLLLVLFFARCVGPRRDIMMGTLIAVLNLAWLPQSQLALSALACTDLQIPSMLFLNQYPWMACDDQYYKTVFPSALLAATWWILCLPAGVCLIAWSYTKGSRAADQTAMGNVLGTIVEPFRPKLYYWAGWLFVLLHSPDDVYL